MTAYDDTRLAEVTRKHQAHNAAVSLRRFGREVATGAPIATEVYACTLDEHGAETGYIARVRGRTLGEVAADLQRECAKLDVYVDPRDVYCGAWYGAPEREAHAREAHLPEQSFLDEGLSVCFWTEHEGRKGHEVVCPVNARVLCYAVTGSSEGHYVHVDLLFNSDAGPGKARIVQAFLCKTFQGFDHAHRIAREFARLLGV